MQDSPVFRDVRAAMLDMDGVLWRGERPLPGLIELFAFFEEEHIPFALVTNNSTNTVELFLNKLERMGARAAPEQIVTSAFATTEYLKTTFGSDVRVHTVGEVGLHEAMLEAGYPQVMSDADVVVVGMDRDLTYEKLRRATYLIRQGARFIGTNDDLTFPLPDGLAPGTGSILASLKASTGQNPLVIGKPEPYLFEMALRRLGTSAQQTLMVGDRIETDILGAQRAGLRTALVLSGVTTREAALASEIQPDLMFEDIVALRQAWYAIQRA